MAYLVGAVLALATILFVRLAGFDGDRALFPVMLIVIASYYVLFAVMGGGMPDLWVEIAIFAGFAALAVVGFRISLWIVATGLALHGLFDLLRPLALAGRGVPPWWPAFCLSYDLAAAAGLALLLVAGGRRAGRHGL